MNEVVARYAPWSISKVDLAKKCPRAFRFRYVDKMPSVGGTEARVGTVVHRSLELQLQQSPLSPDAAQAQAIAEARDITSVEAEKVSTFYENVVAYVARTHKYRMNNNVIYEAQEQRWGIDENGDAIDYDSPSAFMRGAVDHVLMEERGGVLVVDHKSGKNKPIDEFGKQLDTYSILAHANIAAAKSANLHIHYVKTGTMDKYCVRTREYTRAVLVPWLRGYIEQHATALGDFTPTTNTLCGWCDYLAQCPEGTAFVAAKKLSRKRSTQTA